MVRVRVDVIVGVGVGEGGWVVCVGVLGFRGLCGGGGAVEGGAGGT